MSLTVDLIAPQQVSWLLSVSWGGVDIKAGQEYNELLQGHRLLRPSCLFFFTSEYSKSI